MSEQLSEQGEEEEVKLHDGKFHLEEHLTGTQKRWLKGPGKKWATAPASMGVTLLLYPADAIKTRFQTYGFPSIVSCISHARQTEGWRFLYRGAMIPIVSQAAVRVMTWQLYFNYRERLVDPIMTSWTGSSAMQTILTKGASPDFQVFFTMGIAGALTGATAAVVAAPSEFASIISRVDCLRALDPNKPITASSGTTTAQKGMGSLEAAKYMIQRRGIFSLYAGFKLHLYRDSIGSATYFATWEVQKLFWNTPNWREKKSWFTDFVGGAFSGSAGWIATYTLDTAKTRYQREFVRAVHNSGPRPSYPEFNWRTLLFNPKIYAAKYGIVAFKPPIRSPVTWAVWFSKDSYKGMSLLIGRSMTSNALFMSSVEKINRSIDAMPLHPDEMILH